MDGSRFDALVRALSGDGSRRGLLAGVAGGLVTLGAVGLGDDAALARKRRRRKKRRKQCGRNQTRCGGTCVNLQTDPLNCGGCGHRCQVNEVCTESSCICINVDRSCTGGEATWQCCNADAEFSCSCGQDYYTDPLNCDEDIPEEDCPPAQRCIGTLNKCKTCCPPGSTCEPTTGTCLR